LLQDAVAGKCARPKPSERVIAMVTGIASTDVTVAAEIYRRAKRVGLGAEIALT
jgi:ornithine cyclodeaminase/alanine dehydrogenase-like protein (mu-crystallin family)